MIRHLLLRNLDSEKGQQRQCSLLTVKTQIRHIETLTRLLWLLNTMAGCAGNIVDINYVKMIWPSDKGQWIYVPMNYDTNIYTANVLFSVIC